MIPAKENPATQRASRANRDDRPLARSPSSDFPEQSTFLFLFFFLPPLPEERYPYFIITQPAMGHCIASHAYHLSGNYSYRYSDANCNKARFDCFHWRATRIA